MTCVYALQFLCNGLEEDFAVKKHAAGSAGSELDLLVQSSGKMLLLHKLLPKLKAEGHKVSLIGSLDTVSRSQLTNPCPNNISRSQACCLGKML